MIFNKEKIGTLFDYSRYINGENIPTDVIFSYKLNGIKLLLSIYVYEKSIFLRVIEKNNVICRINFENITEVVKEKETIYFYHDNLLKFKLTLSDKIVLTLVDSKKETNLYEVLKIDDLDMLELFWMEGEIRQTQTGKSLVYSRAIKNQKVFLEIFKDSNRISFEVINNDIFMMNGHINQITHLIKKDTALIVNRNCENYIKVDINDFISVSVNDTNTIYGSF